MITGELEKWMKRLGNGQAVIVDYEVMRDSASRYLDSGFDIVRDSDIQIILDEVNSDEYPDFLLTPRFRANEWLLERCQRVSK